MIAAVLFDLYETLVTERAATPVRASSWGERLGLDAAAFRRAWKPQRVRVLRGEVSFADALVEVGVTLGHAIDHIVVRSLCRERSLKKAALFDQFDPAVVAVLSQLHARGLKLAIVSNCFAEDIEAWPRCRVAQWFDASVFSFDVGAAKPEPEIYRESMRRLSVESAHAVFVRDGGDDELLGAERAGLRAAQATWFRGELADLPSRIPRLSSWQAVLEFAMTG
jgi:HAD superfamily hydrolase (TIGR01509 family)